MDRYAISVGTVTQGFKARDMLKNSGIKASLQRRSKDIGKYGCGYSVIVNSADIEQAKSIITAAGIKILKIEKTAV